jgi:uncharacterized membrane protein YkvI
MCPMASASRFQRYLLPGIIFQSVLIGGAYATGREIVEYGAKYGAMGVWAILTIFVGFSATAAISYEFARRFDLYDYRSFVKALIGPFWPLFDLVFMIMVLVIIAVVSAASASITESILGLPYWLGVVIVVLMVGAINAAGRSAIERFKTFGSVLLYGGYLFFAGAVLWGSRSEVARIFSEHDTSYLDVVTLPAVLATGVLYVGYNLATLPATLFTLDRLTRPSQALWAGVITGALATIPFALTFFAILVFYPDPEILDAEVPWLVMLQRRAGAGITALYAVVVLWTLVETCIGLLHAFTDRIDANLRERKRPTLSPRSVALITTTALVAAALLSRVGLIALVAQGYTLMAYAFLALFVLPLLTVGVWRILRAPR